MKTLLSIFSLTLLLLTGYSMLNEAPAPEPGMGRDQGGYSNSGPGHEGSSGGPNVGGGYRSSYEQQGRAGWDRRTQAEKDKEWWEKVQSSRRGDVGRGGWDHPNGTADRSNKPGGQCFTC